MTSIATTRAPHRPGLAELVQQIRSRANRSDDPHTIAAAVAEVLDTLKPTAELLTAEERAGDPDDYARHTLHTEASFSISAVVWRPGQVTEIHDHLVWCSFVILQGVETETIFDFDGGRLVEVGRSQRGPGSVTGVAPPEDIHMVDNTGDTIAITLHVYGADLSKGTSVRRSYGFRP
jgi:predicted metal-dependent enzyme (double-stranded beta helix superfamily)